LKGEYLKLSVTMNLLTVNGTYGSSKTPCLVFVAENRNGSRWYAAEGSKNVNLTYDEIQDGVDIEELDDVDFFTSGQEIDSEETLEEQIEA
jgi:hypothetical protein